MLSLLIVALVLKELCFPSVLASVFLSGLVAAFDFVPLAIFFCSPLFLDFLAYLIVLPIC
jgi:hypothetical protein